MEPHGTSLAKILSRCQLFEGFSRSDIEVLAAQCEWLELTKSQLLLFQGDPVEWLYLVVEGLIKVYRLDPNRDRQIVIRMNQSGRCIAAMSVILHQPEYPASAEAVETSWVLAISAEALHRLAQQNLTLCNNMLRLVAECTQQVVRVLDRMVFRELDSKPAEYLLSMAPTHGQGHKLPTNTEIAAILGTTPQPVSRKLGQFSSRGLTEVMIRLVRVTNPSTLQKLTQWYEPRQKPSALTRQSWLNTHAPQAGASGTDPMKQTSHGDFLSAPQQSLTLAVEFLASRAFRYQGVFI